MGETRVDLLHLLEDLRDAYPGSLEETILTEIVANSLDSGASRIAFRTDHTAATLTVVDNGSGMTRGQLRRYHDLATSGKQRGSGIGFAGVGIKLGLLACEAVLTESRSGRHHLASLWHLKSRHKAPWKWVEPPGRVEGRGTAVHLNISNALSALLDDGFIEATLRRHFQPLLEKEFAGVLDEHYPDGVVFTVSDIALSMDEPADERVPIGIRLPRKRKAAAIGYLFRADASLPEESRGIAIATRGKVIKRGWDWLGMTPADADRIGGLIDAPALADCLTLNKADFLRTGARGSSYLAFRKAIQESLAGPLAAWGERAEAGEESRRRKARPLERDLRDVLGKLARDFPLLDALAMRRPGGQRKLALDGDGASAASPMLPLLEEAAEKSGADEATVEPTIEPQDSGTGQKESEAERPEHAPDTVAQIGVPKRKRSAHLGLRIDFEERPDDDSLGRLVENTIWVNESHPAYLRALASRQQGYHLAVSVAMTLAPLAVEPQAIHGFVSAFLDRWGAVDAKRR